MRASTALFLVVTAASAWMVWQSPWLWFYALTNVLLAFLCMMQGDAINTLLGRCRRLEALLALARITVEAAGLVVKTLEQKEVKHDPS